MDSPGKNICTRILGLRETKQVGPSREKSRKRKLESTGLNPDVKHKAQVLDRRASGSKSKG